MADIPLTNTIPSNQLTKNSGDLSNDESCISSQDGFIMETQFDKRTRSLDELANISFNYDAALNTTNNTANNTINLTNQENDSDEENSGEQEEELFDELAMLCSGQFKQGTQKNKLIKVLPQNKLIQENSNNSNSETKTNKKNSQEKVSNKLDSNDLYAFDDDEDEDTKPNSKRKIRTIVGGDEDEDDCENEVEAEAEDEEEDDDTKEEDDQEEEEDVDEEAEIEEEEDKSEAKKKNKEKKKVVLFKKPKDNTANNEKEGFFEEEAVLSGSEGESDENYEGESDNSIVFSGDEDELPSDSELKEQLRRIHLKDKMDEDKKQLRMIQEMYLNDKDADKNSRRKQFRWKHLDDFGLRTTISSEEEDEEDDEDENDENKNKEGGFFKSVANGNWKSIRHEREQFVHSKLKKRETLLSDDENKNEDEKDDDDDDDEDGSDDNSNDFKLPSSSLFGSSSSWNSQLMKKGQQLLKQSSLLKSGQTKRGIDDEKRTLSSQNTKSSITIEPLNKTDKKPETNKTQEQFSKFSFLNRDKSYLTRLSSYVNKNLSDKTEKFSFKSIRPNNMVFTTIDVDNQNSNVSNEENKSKNITKYDKLKKTPNYQKSSIEITELENVKSSEAKRAKYDNSESIFNHF